MSQVILIRPGATDYDEQGRVQGVLDLPLSERGRAEVAELAGRLAGTPLAAVYCGPAESAVRTAEAVGRAAGLRPKRLDDLRNLDQGLWQGLHVEEVRRRHPKVFRQWLDDPRTVCPPGGESVEDALERLREAVRPLLRRHHDEIFAVVVAEPLAQLLSGFLRRTPRLQLAEDAPTAVVERIDLPAEWLRNGDPA